MTKQGWALAGLIAVAIVLACSLDPDGYLLPARLLPDFCVYPVHTYEVEAVPTSDAGNCQKLSDSGVFLSTTETNYCQLTISWGKARTEKVLYDEETDTASGILTGQNCTWNTTWKPED